MKKTRIELLKETAEANGLTIWSVAMKAGVPHSTVMNWEKKEPKSFVTYDNMVNALYTLIAEKSE